MSALLQTNEHMTNNVTNLYNGRVANSGTTSTTSATTLYFGFHLFPGKLLGPFILLIELPVGILLPLRSLHQ